MRLESVGRKTIIMFAAVGAIAAGLSACQPPDSLKESLDASSISGLGASADANKFDVNAIRDQAQNWKPPG